MRVASKQQAYFSISHGVANYFPGLWVMGISDSIFISRRALAREGDYEMMSVCACVRECVRVCVS